MSYKFTPSCLLVCPFPSISPTSPLIQALCLSPLHLHILASPIHLPQAQKHLPKAQVCPGTVYSSSVVPTTQLQKVKFLEPGIQQPLFWLGHLFQNPNIHHLFILFLLFPTFLILFWYLHSFSPFSLTSV